MCRRILCFLAMAWASVAVLPAANPQTATPASTHRALLSRYCVTCHNQQLRTAGLTLDTTDVETVSKDSEVWEKVLRKLRAGAMPPVGLPRPDPAAYNAFAALGWGGTPCART